MKQAEVEAFLTGLDNVQQTENFGYTFFFVGDDHRIPFVSVADSDNAYDNVSNLDREGVFRINIRVSKETFQHLVGEADSQPIDYSVLDVFLPHPDYARQHFVCILNPSPARDETLKELLREAHALETTRSQRKIKH